MSRRDNAEVRCRACRMHESLCVCALVPRLETRTRLVLVLHRLEARKTTNTGQLAAACLPNSEVIVRGVEGEPPPRFVGAPGSTPLYLFPDEGATPLLEHAGSASPVTLIVPDGTWRQAGKMRKRVAGLADVPCVSLPEESSASRRLRAETREHGLSTLEAIARALGILEGEAVRDALERLLRTMVERTLWLRGALPSDRLTDGLPAAAATEDPRGGPRAQRRRMR